MAREGESERGGGVVIECYVEERLLRIIYL